jgi:Peptidase family M23
MNMFICWIDALRRNWRLANKADIAFAMSTTRRNRRRAWIKSAAGPALTKPQLQAHACWKTSRIMVGMIFLVIGNNASATEGPLVLSAKGTVSVAVPASEPEQTAFGSNGVLPSGLDVPSGLSLDRAQRWQSDTSVPSHRSRNLQNPISPFNYTRISSDFGRRKDPLVGAWRNHQGIDLPGVKGTPIYASNDGWVTYSGYASGYGLLVRIEHGQRVESLYGHLSRVAVSANRSVFRGALIGYLGSTGRSTGADPLIYLATATGRTQGIPQPLAQQSVPVHVSDYAKQHAKRIEMSAGLPGSL